MVQNEQEKLINDRNNDESDHIITPWNEKFGFFFAGLLNNLSYCIILDCIIIELYRYIIYKK